MKNIDWLIKTAVIQQKFLHQVQNDRPM